MEHKIINKKLEELNINDDLKQKIEFLKRQGFNTYLALTKDYYTNELKLSSWLSYEKEEIYAQYNSKGAGFEWLKSVSTVHKPNYNTGSGWQVIEASNITNDDLLDGWIESEKNILSGKEKNFNFLNEELKFWDIIKVD